MQSDEARHALAEDGTAEEAKFRTTVTLTESELTSLDELRVYFRRTERRAVDRSQLIREAIRCYREAILAG
jgi:metal-responsive CopG/Arc/MetJ family transcriptional regulator